MKVMADAKVVLDRVDSEGKKYHIIEDIKEMDQFEIWKAFPDLWVYLTNIKLNQYHGIGTCIPRIVAESKFVGLDDGIYDEYRYNPSVYGLTGESDDCPVPDIPMLF